MEENMAKALVIYFSRTGHTAKMAEAIAEGITSSTVSVTMVPVEKANVDDLLEADAIVLGSPCYYGTMAAELKSFIDQSVKYHEKLSGKVGGAFSSAGMLGGGNETTVMSILNALLVHGMVVAGNSKIAHYGPVAISKPDEKALAQCVKYGERIGELTSMLTK
jgi:NAD(P)H dehydrogenase (quinone)